MKDMEPSFLLEGKSQTTSRSLASIVVALLAVSMALSAVLIVPSARATNGVVKDTTFLLHSVNATETAKPLPSGGSTLTYFDTTLDFNDKNVSILVEGTQKVLQWFLVPALAGDFSVDGFTLRIWANSSTSASSNAQVTIEILEVNATTSVQVHQINLGSQNFPVTLRLMNWSASFSSYVFRAGSSIELRLTVTPGALQGVWFHYDTAQLNSRVSLHGPDSLDVAGIATLDSGQNPRTSFDPLSANKTMYIQARVTDPLGGYDIRWVNLTLTSPSGALLLDNISMNRVSGTSVDFESAFEFSWNYSGQPVGPYTILIWALDNNGHNYYYFFQQFSYGDYPDSASATFYIGGLPAYVNVKAVDSKNVALAGARIDLVSGEFTVDTRITDASGIANLSMAKGSYEFQVFWEDVRVASVSMDVQSNVSASTPFVINTQVYYPVFQAEDAEGSALAGASLIFIHPNGEKLGPFKTNNSGQVTLSQVPVGTYGLFASWRGVDVFSGTVDVRSNDIVAFKTAVYKLTVTAKAGNGQALAGVFVSVADSTGMVFDAGLTNSDGSVVLRLPAGNYTIQARYVTSYMGSLYDSGVRTAQIELSTSTATTVTFADFPILLTSTLAFLFALAYGVTVAAFLVLIYLLLRRKERGRVKSEEPEKKP